MIQNLIKKALRKWLKKKVYNSNQTLSKNIAHFEWVYNSPLYQWRDRIWIIKQQSKVIAGIDLLDKILKEYLYK